MKAELFSNLDEVGMSEWDDRKEKKVIVPATMNGQTRVHRASRRVRHISIITCIAAAGESLTRSIMTSRDSDAIRKGLMNRCVRPGVDFVLRHRSKPHVNSRLFLEYINTIFVLYLNELWNWEELEACETVLLMDDCSPHMSNHVVRVLTRIRVRIITFTTHTSHIFQMLDVVLFSALKKHVTGLETLNEEQSAAAFLPKVHHDFKQIMIKVNIWEVFAAIAFTYDIKQNL
jgi:hypothetical protein